LDAIAVENSAYPGTPDVNFVEGWLELKQLEEWPKRPDTPVTIEHFTAQQRVWLIRRWRKRGNAFLLLRVGQEWFLFDGETAATHVGKVNRIELIRLSLEYWPRGLKGKELLYCLKSRN
jgi:hypothetical protein